MGVSPLDPPAEMTGVVGLKQLRTALDKRLPERHRKLLELNKKALNKGAEKARE